MVKLQKWEKQELLQIHRQTRSNLRCVIVIELKDERDVLVGDMNTEIGRLIAERDELLAKHKLSEFQKSSYGCGVTEKHPRLIEFDNETDQITRQIVLGETKA